MHSMIFAPSRGGKDLAPPGTLGSSAKYISSPASLTVNGGGLSVCDQAECSLRKHGGRKANTLDLTTSHIKHRTQPLLSEGPVNCLL